MTSLMREIDYVLGDGNGELRRLMRQASAYEPLTEAFLRSANLRPAGRVLDLGCGPGDVTMAVAELVGRDGQVVGVDRSAAALNLARSRVAARGYPNVSLELVDVDAYLPSMQLDGVVGRLVLMYQPDAAATLARLRPYLAPGAVVCFQEIDMTVARSVPMAPLIAICKEWILEALRRSGAPVDQGSTLHRLFRRAGLPTPQLSVAQLAEADGAPVICGMLASVIASLLPRICEYGIATEAEIGLSNFEQRLQEQVQALDAVVYSPSLIGAIARLPAR